MDLGTKGHAGNFFFHRFFFILVNNGNTILFLILKLVPCIEGCKMLRMAGNVGA